MNLSQDPSSTKAGSRILPQGPSFRILALCDSYSCWEGLPRSEGFPAQVAALLRGQGMTIDEPEIIALTGWTTEGLQEALNKASLSNDYDVVTLLIGVNDQYQGFDLEGYRKRFDQLLKEAIRYGKNNPLMVVLSVPDWGVTPYARKYEALSPAVISAQIDSFNAVNQAISTQYGENWLDITSESRKMRQDRSLMAADGLHPSGKEYAIWARALVRVLDSNGKTP